MCGRYRLSRRKQIIEEYFETAYWQDEWSPRYNIAPTQPILVVQQRPKEPVRKLSLMKWGLIPSWSKDPSAAARMINARSETASNLPAFRDTLKFPRCLIPADGFYDWQRSGKTKQPFCFEVRDGELFAFAGIWDRWQGGGIAIETCSILTTTPNAVTSPVHDRMPVILHPDIYDLWLDPGMTDVATASDLLKPYDGRLMRCYPVSTRVNQVANDDEECSRPGGDSSCRLRPLHTFSLGTQTLTLARTRFLSWLAAFLFLIPPFAFTQQTAAPSPASSSPNSAPPKPTAAPESVIVTGTFEPIPLSESNRSVVSFDTQTQPLLYHSFIDYLAVDPSIDLQQREVDGVQADLSIRGSSFEQSLVLVNGFRVNDAQTGHHDLDIPLPLESIARIEVLHGVGSTLYGADAVGGAVNFITSEPTAAEFRVRIGFGNFGFDQQHLSGSLARGNLSEQISVARDASSGFRTDRDYTNESLSSETRFKSGWGETDVLLAGSDRPFGADQFYGDFPSWERTKSWFASIDQTAGENTDLAFGYRRHADEFVLVRDEPSLYENNHVSQNWQAAVRRRSTIRESDTVAYGFEADGDVIDSNNLGHHARNREAGYLNFDLRFWQRVFLSAGAREEGFSGGRTEFSPTLAGGIWLRDGLRLRASVSRGFRLPTYTDLYYSDPANLGNPLLQPESAWGFEAGPEWNPGGRFSAQLTGFYRRERNDIDYVKSSASAPWQATNIGKLNFAGLETLVRAKVRKGQELEFAYTALHGSEPPQPGLISKYVFNYPRHNATFAWLGEFKHAIAVRNRVGVTQRFGQDAYPLWDIAATRARGRVRPYIQLSNLSNTGYEEISGVSMPGRSVIGGVEIVFGRDALH